MSDLERQCEEIRKEREIAHRYGRLQEQLRDARARAEEQIGQLREQLAQKDMTIGAYIKREQDIVLRLAAVTAERGNLCAFANAILEDFPESAPDGFEIQDLAEKYGLLKPIKVSEPCDPESCQCAEVGDFPMDCYRKTNLLTGEL